MAGDSPTAQLSYCAQQVRDDDYDRYLCCLFAPADRREALFALHAFNLEIARTREVVSDAMLGQIRLQWWRDSVSALYAGNAPRHYVLDPLGEAVRRFDLPVEHFETMIAARETDLDREPPQDMASLEAYADSTAVPLIQLALGIVGGDGNQEARHAAREVGLAYALTGLLRAIVFHARDKRLYVPEETVQRTGLSRRDLFELRPSAELDQAVYEIAERARGYLKQARKRRKNVPKAALPALLPARVAASHLDRLAKASHNVFSPRVQRSSPLLPLGLSWDALRGRY